MQQRFKPARAPHQRCMVYMDLNMVRAGAVKHPSEWDTCGYNEIQSPKKRYGLIDHNCLVELLGLTSMEALEAAPRDELRGNLSSTVLRFQVTPRHPCSATLLPHQRHGACRPHAPPPTMSVAL